MKGHLNVKDLEGYKKADLQKLARDLGVSDEGTVKEIAARCAAVEVDIPDDQEGTAPDDQEGTAPEDQEGTAPDNQEGAADANQGEVAQEDKPAVKAKPGEVIVEVVKRYKDLELKRIVAKGERLPMKEERAAVIIGKNLGKLVEE